MVLSKAFSMITNAFLDENRLQGLDEIGMEKSSKVEINSEISPSEEDALNDSDDTDEFDKDRNVARGYGFPKVFVYSDYILS